jgi:hypothetical protein
MPPVRRGATDLTATRIIPRGADFATPPILSAYAAVPPAPAAFVTGRGLY